MEPRIVQKLLPELKSASLFFEDVTFRCLVNPESSKFETSSTKVNSLIVAAISPMLARALIDLQYDDEITIIVTEGISNKDLNLFFTSIFNWNFCDTSDSQNFESVEKVLELLSIKFSLEINAKSDLCDDSDVTKSLQIDASVKSFKCDECEAIFRSLKQKQRHTKTAHSENHPHVCQLCGRRCRGPAGKKNLFMLVIRE